ncbi:MAG: toll/interleukin-1 receptor domain-containing protein [Hydrogenophaga sp.]|nr:toll/interleukin-1 receptor domain-containing protein [Hydrogenophaga sp.]
MNRIFISYRSSDGKKDADRLCADLSRLLGEEQVFFDKQDLQGGSSWSDAIQAALDARPVVLLLITPDLLGMAHPDGGRRIDRDDDPIRNELLAARQAHATVIPLLTEGMQMPPVASVPEPLRFITESHALKLRTDDWPADLQRVVEDLGAHGIHTAQPTPSPPPQAPGPAAHRAVRRLQKGLMIFGGVVAVLLLIGLVWPEDPALPPGCGGRSTTSSAACACCLP